MLSLPPVTVMKASINRSHSRIVLSCLAAIALLAPRSALAQSEEHFRVPVGGTGLRVFLRHRGATSRGVGSARAPVLFVHGSSFPSALAAAFRFDGTSWMDDLARQGFDVWALDFLGYGESDRYPEMSEPPFAHQPLGRASDAERQIEAAVNFIISRRRVPRVSIIAHSWGTIAAGSYAGRHADRVERLVQFGPVAQRQGVADTTRQPAHVPVTEDEQRERFYGYVPKGEDPVFDPRQFAEWGPAYLASDSTSRTRIPRSVEVPNGPTADIIDAWSGHLPYDPSAIAAPVLLIRGEWDKVTRDADASWLYDAMTHARLKRDVKISRGTHVMHLEASRRQLYREVSSFLAEDDRTTQRAMTQPESSRRELQTRSIRIAGFGDLSGPARSFGVNSRAALVAATGQINASGSVRLADGAVARIELSYSDDHCRPADALALVRQFEASDVLVAVGPSCSSVAEPLFHALQARAGDSSDSGIRLPVFTDGATKANLARISEWAFRNTPNEATMYRTLWRWVRVHHPDYRTIAGGDESDFSHSHATWSNIILPEAEGAGLVGAGSTSWSISDTTFVSQVRQLKAVNADVVVLSSHATTTCGMLREMARQRVHPKLVVGLTSASTSETLRRCGAEAEGVLIPTSFSPMTPAARRAARSVGNAGGIADLHSMAAWEIAVALKSVIEHAQVLGKPESVMSDRRAIRAGLASMQTMEGFLGPITRTPEREATKPFVLVQARRGIWRVVFDPRREAAGER
jgi:branched-chain amino acid transport system substrate-binding protein